MHKRTEDNVPNGISINESVGSQQQLLSHSDTRVAKQESRKAKLDKVKTGLDKAQTAGLILGSCIVM
jgi:hypothetical protein